MASLLLIDQVAETVLFHNTSMELDPDLLKRRLRLYLRGRHLRNGFFPVIFSPDEIGTSDSYISIDVKVFHRQEKEISVDKSRRLKIPAQMDWEISCHKYLANQSYIKDSEHRQGTAAAGRDLPQLLSVEIDAARAKLDGAH